VALVTALLLGCCALLAPSRARLVGLLLLSPLPLLGLLRPRWRLGEVLSVPPSASLWLWAVLAWSLWKVRLGWVLPWAPMLLGLGVAAWAWFRPQRWEVSVSWSDATVIVSMAAIAFWIVPVFIHNGLEEGRYLAHSWFGRDTFYFFALAQEALDRQAWPAENPFLAGVANWYPALLHVGWGALAGQSGQVVAIAMSWAAPVLLITAPGILVALGQRAGWPGSVPISVTTLLGVAGPFLLRPDLFTYPQTTCFAFAWLWLGIWLWNDRQGSVKGRLAGFAVLTGLVLAHTVAGSVAVIFLGGKALEGLWVRDLRREGAWVAAGALAVAFVFVKINGLPFPGPSGPLSLRAYSEFESYLRPWLVPLGGLALVLLGNRRRPLSWVIPLGAVGLGLAYSVYGSTQLDPNSRWFVYFNAERLLHLALLVAIPLAAAGRLWGLVGVAVVVVSAVVHPTDLARSWKTLITTPTETLGSTELKLFERIRAETPVDARFISFARGYALPAFTGRSQTPNEKNIWGLNTLPNEEFRARLNDARRFWSYPPAQRLAVLDRWGYGYILLDAPVDPPNLETWLADQFPAGGVRVAFSSGRWLVLACVTGRP